MKLELNSPLLKETTEIHMREEELLSFQEYDDPLKTNIYVFNDYEYNSFRLVDSNGYISEFYINDEAIQIKQSDDSCDIYEFKCDKSLKEDKRIFLQCFGVVRIKVVISGKVYVSDSISVMVTNNNHNKNT